MSRLEHETDPAVQAEKDRQLMLFSLLGVFLGVWLYGIYVVLFARSVQIKLKKKSSETRPASVFFYSSILMFIIITVNTAFAIRRYAHAFTTFAYTTNEIPLMYLFDYTLWDNSGCVFMLNLLVWMADALAIYRCYLIWNDSLLVILFPSALLLVSIIINSITFSWFLDMTSVDSDLAMTLLKLVYPINISQNIVTTSLIAVRIYLQHRLSRKAGLNNLATTSSGVHLLTVMRIVIESAMLFTVQQIVMMILLYSGHMAEMIFHGTTAPTIGIIFLLISVRSYEAQRASQRPSTWDGEGTSWSREWSVATHRSTQTDIQFDPIGTATSSTPRQRKSNVQVIAIYDGEDGERSESDIGISDNGDHGELKLRTLGSGV
ncbi:hypothetical protein CC1G_09607 [Coprinopsis cinerea okayama7|uniref:Integral membrane protein n=1 Tax=Coprinopsis cinerea (strain Okayama-7 / 130 / ATCC MYA-4618 / FGSC 9003) TaxID=240176 RepID=A8N4C3_COPC7|nr:hypothetical protein CC1G_09607 [Coprinopsis cinerea okayama7\|eukprot:XP_001829718.2 hypothetical protein CC1G_09607 [Coprinopsis cinerea okayama7\